MHDTPQYLEWSRKIIAGESIIPPPLYPEVGDYALSIFKELRVCDLPGKPTFGEVSAQWVFDFVRCIFGAYNVETGIQEITEFGLLISKKNTKSTIAAGIMLTSLILDFRENNETLILAPTKEAAESAFRPAASMVRADDELSDMFKASDRTREIFHRTNGNSLKIVAADTSSVVGKKAGRILIDELWKFGTINNADNILYEATGGQVSRPEGFTLFLTTQSDDSPAGVFKDRLNYWRDVRDGIIDDSKTLPVLYEFPAEMVESKAYLEPENFYVTNPNIGRSVSQDWLEDNLKKAQTRADGAFQQFLAKHLNIEIGLSLRNDRWAAADMWLDCGEQMSLDDLLDRSEVVTMGIDGGGLSDLLGFSVLGREEGTGQWLHWTHCWAHESVLTRHKEIAPRLKDFEAEGDLTIVQNVGQDIRDLADLIKKVHARGLLPKDKGIGVDPIGINYAELFNSYEIPEELLIGISQGYKLNSAIVNLERKIASGRLTHANQDMMSWQVSNSRIEPRSNAVLITKSASGKAKIDAVMSMLNAAMLLQLNPQAAHTKFDVFFVS